MANDAPMNEPTTPATTPTTTTETPPAPNTPEARTETGELRDLSSTTSTGSKDEGTKAATAPEAYQPFTLPEGAKLDDKALERATSVFKELNLDQAGAQKVIDLHNAISKEFSDGLTARVNQMREDWRAAVKADKDMGPNLSKVSESIGRAKSLLPPDVRDAFSQAMDQTGVGDHPAFVKALWKLSEMITEGRPVTAGGPSAHGQTSTGKAGPASLAAAMYPNLPHG